MLELTNNLVPTSICIFNTLIGRGVVNTRIILLKFARSVVIFEYQDIVRPKKFLGLVSPVRHQRVNEEL